MLPSVKEGDVALSQLSRQQLIDSLLATNEHSSFQFTPEWLRKQWTFRLRALLAHRRQQLGQAQPPPGQSALPTGSREAS